MCVSAPLMRSVLCADTASHVLPAHSSPRRHAHRGTDAAAVMPLQTHNIDEVRIRNKGVGYVEWFSHYLAHGHHSTTIDS